MKTEYSFDNETWYDAPDGKAFVPGVGEVYMRATQPPAQASDEPMRSLDERRVELEADAVRINAGRKPRFGDWMRNPWAGESNPHRDGMFVQSKRVTGKFNPGMWYEMTDGEGAFWSSNGKVLFFIDAPRAALKAQPAHDRQELTTTEVDGQISEDLTIKAQPAPTEAAQYPNTPEIDALMEKWSDDGATRGAAFIELRDKARQIERAFYAAVEQARTMAYAAQGNPSNNSSSSAQGEDSARLDAERYRYFRRIYGAEARLIRGPIYAAETPEQFDAGIDECIRYEQEVARASAETGGVKP